MTVETLARDDTFAVPAGGERVDRAVAALRGNGYTVYVVDSVEDARRRVIEVLPEGKSVFTAASETLRLSGIAADVNESGRLRSVRRDAEKLEGDFVAQVKLGATPDVVVGSVHAVTEDGHLVIASASGSQLAPYAAGATTAIWVVGAQKLVPDLETALRRIRSYSLPLESERCQREYGQPAFIGKILICQREAFPDRGIVVLIRQAIGF